MYFEEGVSYAEISRRTGYNYRTLKKYIEKDNFNEIIKRKTKRACKLDPLKPIIDKWLEDDLKIRRKQRHTAKRVYDRLCSEYPDQMHASLRTVQSYVGNKKKEIGKMPKQARLPLKHFPGEAQLDFGEVDYIDEMNTQKTAYKLTISFPYSNKSYCQVRPGENQECLLQEMKDIFEYIGHVPTRIVFDNMSTAVAQVLEGHNRKLSEGFERFTMHYGYKAAFCNRASGWEKGNVENKVGYERRNFFVPLPRITDWDEFNKKLFKICDEDGERKHVGKNLYINKLFEEDIAMMLDLPRTPYDVYKLESRKCNNYAIVCFEGNRYSVSPRYANQNVKLRIESDRIVILNQDLKEIVSHKRLYGHDLESMNWLPYLELMQKRPRAIKYTEFYNNLPPNWQKYLRGLSLEDQRKNLGVLTEILLKSNMTCAEEALQSTISTGLIDADSIMVAFRKLHTPKMCLEEMKLDNILPKVTAHIPDTSKYDSLLNGGNCHAGNNAQIL